MSFFEYFKKRDGQLEHVRHIPDDLDQELYQELSENAEEDELRSPEDAEEIRKFTDKLRTILEQHVKKQCSGSGITHAKVSPVDAATAVYLSANHMSAYVCLLPPLSGGADSKLEKVMEDLHFEGLAFGLDEVALKAAIDRRQYLHILPIARGKRAKDGEDAQISDFFTRKDVFELESKEGEQIDFDEKNLIQAVHKGEVICRLTPAVPAQDGMDVTGRTLRGKSGRHLSLPQGENTVLSQDGLFLIAGIDGAVCTRGGLFCVERQKVIFSDVDASIGDLDYPGAVLIKGDVHDGRTVKASGNIIIEGCVKNATIISEGSVRIQHGVQGNRTGGVRATHQVQCKLIEETTVVAGGSVFAEAIVDSDITSGGSVYVTGGRGLLVGGQVKARNAVEAKRIGNQSGALSLIILNYNPNLKNKASRIHDELKKVRNTLEDLQRHISTLRLKSASLSREQRDLLARLVEQRELYEGKKEELIARSRQTAEELSDMSANWVISGDILPTTVIRLGDKSLTIRSQLKNCNIHMASGTLVNKPTTH